MMHQLRLPRGLPVLLTAVLLLCLIALPASAQAAETDSAASGVLLASWWNEILGNQTRMIQVALVVIAIGIFLLTRTYR